MAAGALHAWGGKHYVSDQALSLVLQPYTLQGGSVYPLYLPWESAMQVATPDKAILKELFDHTSASGNGDAVPLHLLAERIQVLQEAGVPVYRTRRLGGIERALMLDTSILEEHGLVSLDLSNGTCAVALTGAGELFASNLEYPEWVEWTREHQPTDSECR